MNFFSSLASNVGKFVEEVSEAVQETVLVITSAEDFYETREAPRVNNNNKSEKQVREELNEWTLLEDDIDEFKDRVVRVPQERMIPFLCLDQLEEFHGEWGIFSFLEFAKKLTRKILI
jgi:hypothetical protein